MHFITSNLLAFVRLILFIIIITLMVPIHVVVKYVFRYPYFMTLKIHSMLCWLLNVKIQMKGNPCDEQCFFLSNHLSWSDIFVLGSVLSARFIAKREVGGWPLFGQLSLLQDTIFIERSRAGIKAGQQKIKAALKNGDSLIMFPEGTNTWEIGNLAPLKSNFLSVFENTNLENVFIQSVTITINEIENASISNNATYERYAWPDVSFVAHLWRFFGTKSFNVTLTFGERFTAGQMDRKEITARIENEMKENIENEYS